MQVEITTLNKALIREKAVSRDFSFVSRCSVVFMIHPILSKKDTFGTGIDFRLIESKVKGVKKDRDQVNRCSLYRSVRLREVSVN